MQDKTGDQGQVQKRYKMGKNNGSSGSFGFRCLLVSIYKKLRKNS
jgi:hypothetical protein